MLLAGVLALGFARAGDGTPLQVQMDGGDAPVNAGAGDPADITSHNSPAVGRNPTDAANLVVANRVDTPQYSCALHVSTDGGNSWDETPVPIPEGEEPKCYAPDVAFGADGTLYVSYVTLRGIGNVPEAVWLVTSTDGGRSVSEPVRIGGPRAFQVRLAAAPDVPGRLYLTWLDVDEVVPLGIPETGQPIRAANSDDGGRTWSDPVTVNDPARGRVVAPEPVVAAGGDWYVAYLDLRDDRLNYHGAHGGRGGPAPPGPWELVVARSVDGGQTWAETTVDELVPTERFVVFVPPYPSLAVGDGGRVHVVFHDGRAGPGADVWLWSSDDGAATWGEGVRVNDNPPGDGTRQYLPQVALAPGGRIDVVYYDRRADPDDVHNEVSLQASADGGQTFTDRVVLSDVAFDSRIGFGSFRGLAELGTRLGLLSAPDQALAVWADTRAGTEASRKQDLMHGVVAFEGGPAPQRTDLLVAGLALVTAGAAICIAALVMSMHTRRRQPLPPSDRNSLTAGA